MIRDSVYPSSFLVGCAVLCLLLAASPARAAQFTDPTLGFSLAYPDGWTLEQFPDAAIEIRNFSSDQYLYAGNVPLGGAEIFIRVFPPYVPPWAADTDEYALFQQLAQWSGGRSITVSSRASGPPARGDFVRETAANTTNKDVIIALRKGGRLFFFNLDYQAADPAGSTFEQALGHLVESVSVAAALTPAPPATAVPAAPPTASTSPAAADGTPTAAQP
jgi:hypothetical protein